MKKYIPDRRRIQELMEQDKRDYKNPQIRYQIVEDVKKQLDLERKTLQERTILCEKQKKTIESEIEKKESSKKKIQAQQNSCTDKLEPYKRGTSEWLEIKRQEGLYGDEIADRQKEITELQKDLRRAEDELIEIENALSENEDWKKKAEERKDKVIEFPALGMLIGRTTLAAILNSDDLRKEKILKRIADYYKCEIDEITIPGPREPSEFIASVRAWEQLLWEMWEQDPEAFLVFEQASDDYCAAMQYGKMKYSADDAEMHLVRLPLPESICDFLGVEYPVELEVHGEVNRDTIIEAYEKLKTCQCIPDEELNRAFLGVLERGIKREWKLYQNPMVEYELSPEHVWTFGIMAIAGEYERIEKAKRDPEYADAMLIRFESSLRKLRNS